MGQLAKSTFIAIVITLMLGVSTAFAAPDATCSVPSTAHATLQTAVDDATCGTIDLAANVFNENVTIARSMIIKGSVDADNTPLTTIDGQQLDSVFTIHDFNTVVFRNLVIQNGKSAENGGGIHIVDNASVTLDNVLLTNNSAENGGGLYANSGFLNIINSTIQHNSANHLGGGLFGALGSVDMRSFKMYHNSAEDGGAIGVANAALLLQDGDFSGNAATRNGGAIFMTVPNGTSSFTNLNLNQNTAGNLGGAIFSRRGLSLTGGTLNNNAAIDGGALYVERNSLNLMQTNFSDNNASGNGGAIFATKLQPGFVTDAKLTITKSSLIDNQSDNKGGAVYAEGDIDLTINETGFYSNTATFGGAIGSFTGDIDGQIVPTDFKVNASIMQHNRATDGGAIFTESSALTVSNSDVSHNVVTGIGGAIAAASNLDLFNSSLTHNSAQVGGGAVETSASSTLTIDGVWFAHNSTQGTGGAVRSSGPIVMRNSTVYQNSANAGGGIGALFGTLDIAAVAFDNNHAVQDGGALLMGRHTAGALRNLSVTNNSAGADGGGLLVSGGFEMSGALFGYNEAGASGGGIAVVEAKEQIRIRQTTIYRNSAENGGGISQRTADNPQILNLTNVTISENSATALGSALHGSGPIIAAFSTIGFNNNADAVHKLTDATPFIFQFSIIHNPTVNNCAGDISTIQLATTIDSDGTCATTRTPLSGIDPLLAPLGENGNAQFSHALLPSSPAIGGGEDCPSFDQHDNGRPTVNCDLGAFQSPLAPTAVKLSSQALQTSLTGNVVYALLLALAIFTTLAVSRKGRNA